MSLAINATVSSGIIIAADSRQSYRNQKNMVRIGSDNATKLFQLNKRIGCAVTGIAFLPSDKGIRNINAFIDEFKRIEDVQRLDVVDMAKKLHSYFEQQYEWPKQIELLKTKIKGDLLSKGCDIIGDFEEKNGQLLFKFKDKNGRELNGAGGVDKILIMIGGFNQDGSHQVYVCSIPGEIIMRRDSNVRGKEFGASWMGQSDVTSRIVLGWDDRIFALPFMQEQIKSLGEEKITQQLKKLQYKISWGTMTIQDATDFCILIIRTTEAIQRFSDGISLDPGGMPGVGGEIDVAVITRDKGFVWLKKKNLNIDGKEIDLDTYPNL